MNKQELIKAVQLQIKENGFEFTQEEVSVAINALAEVVSKTVIDGEKVKIPGIVTVDSKPTKARKGRNPKTEEEIDIPASKKVTFKVDEGFKKSVKATV